ncbi:hypothetical protein LNP25_28910 [Klebsiella variicola subsp. variicola]|nr:hypothetical protein [Klebsiella variicola subsp. variicola]
MTLPVEQAWPVRHSVIFTSFGFHGSVPSIVSYLGGDIRKLRRVFLIGSFIPLVAIFSGSWRRWNISSPAFTALLAKHAGLIGLLEAVREVVASPRGAGRTPVCRPRAGDLIPRRLVSLFDYMAGVFQRKNSVSGRPQERRDHLPAAGGVRPVLSRGFVMGPGLRRGGTRRAGLMLPACWQ